MHREGFGLLHFRFKVCGVVKGYSIIPFLHARRPAVSKRNKYSAVILIFKDRKIKNESDKIISLLYFF